MVLNRLLSFLASRHGYELITRLSETSLIRSAARLSVYFFLKGRYSVKEITGTDNFGVERVRSFGTTLRNNLRDELKKAKQELTKRQQEK